MIFVNCGLMLCYVIICLEDLDLRCCYFSSSPQTLDKEAGLLRYDVRNKTRHWVQASLANRTQQVVVKGKFSDIAQVQSGFPQRSVLGPCTHIPNKIGIE